MLPELGHLALILALVMASVQATLPLVGAASRRARWMDLARPAAEAQFVLVVFAFGCLAWSFVSNDFSVGIVATHSNSQLPIAFRFAATWGSHEGSLMLWILMLAGWTVAVATIERDLPQEMLARVLGVLGIVAVGFLAFLLLTSNPFVRLVPAALDGRDLNPVLQDWGMVLHPPMLYMGYVGFAVAFAFAIAALLAGSLDAAWARHSRRWTTAAWCFLTVGIALGSWWAYRVLGWGGWWFWDPVENASFMPWLVGTALMHSLAVADRRGAFGRWTALLAIGAFSLSLLGTFLVRSGVLSSVHTFANDPLRGIYLLAFLVFVVGGSLALFAWRAPRIATGGRFALVSRETFLLANNLLLMVAAGTVFLGTLYPLVLDAFGLGKISVGPPYFESVFVPLMAPLAFLVGVGPLARWKEARIPELVDRLKGAFVVAIATAILLPVTLGHWSIGTALGLLLATWIVASTMAGLLERVRRIDRGLGARLAAQPRGYYGMLVAHCGLAVFIAGVTLVKSYEVERDLTLAIGQTVDVGPYTVRFAGADSVVGPNYTGSRGTIEVLHDGVPIDRLHPEKRRFNVQRTVTTEAAIRSGIAGDLYVSLGEPLANGAWSLRLCAKPFVDWIWGGCLLMALGGGLAISGRRVRRLAERTAAIAPQPA